MENQICKPDGGDAQKQRSDDEKAQH